MQGTLIGYRRAATIARTFADIILHCMRIVLSLNIVHVWLCSGIK